MGNDTRYDKIEARLDSLIGEIGRRTEQRDGELGDAREALAELAVRVTAVETAVRIAAEAHKPPGWWAIIGAVAAAAGLMATVGSSFLRPLESEVANLKEWRGEQLKDLKDVREKQFTIRHTLSELRGEVTQLEKQIDAVDNRGSRKWVEQPKE